ncbi:hypothetical protein P3X46_025905 [Hevea brasiliensis]|uniref:TmcB/TmcC TPR repeats domain-containing protein n=1 Tax=Hevea brasiliensis TaxID=3981 RepID=A0ABQ9KUX5_HEVBR|nr:uncharacterized protein LOC110673739 [Hevea brasiliensis]KAJ9152328.1 hypothetical protein P3X46_025905 [Hevea brasiliensis]
MKAFLWRTGSVPVHAPVHPDSPKFSLSRRNSVSGIFSGENHNVISPRISLHLEINRHRDTPIRLTSSETDLMGSETELFGMLTKLSGSGSLCYPAMMPEEEQHFLGSDLHGCGSTTLNDAGFWPDSRIPLKKLGFTGDGFGKGKKYGGGNGGNDDDWRSDLIKMGDYYKEMLKSNPSDSLLLRNYGKFLHEVEGDRERAEEYYARAILASPGDGEVLSLYGKLIWDSHRDGERAQAYFDQAVSASPNDCMVLGSYAHFMWEAEEDDEEVNGCAEASPALVAAL